MRKVFIAIGVVSMFSAAAAQKLEVGLDGGYGLPAGTALVGHNTIFDTLLYTPKTFEEVYSTGGMGWKMTGDVVYYPFENIGIMLIAGYSTRSRYDTISSYENWSNMVTDTVTTCHVPLNIGIKIRTKIGIAEPYLYVAPGVIFPRKTESAFDSMASTAVKRTYWYSMGFSVTAGCGAAVMITRKIGIRAEFSPTYASASPNRYEEVIKNTGGTTGKTYKYKDNTLASQLGLDEVQSRPHDSFCSMAFKVGMLFRFF